MRLCEHQHALSVGGKGLRTRKGGAGAATALFRTSGSDVALSMAQRLAKRFKKQIFLSVDIPASFLTLGQGARVLLEAEKGVVAALKELETGE